MEELEKMYMLFTAADTYFLIPLFWVKSVISGEKIIENLPVLDFVSMVDDSVPNDRRYQLELEAGQCRFVIRVERVIGIQEIAADQLRELPASVMNDSNRYLSKVIRMTTEELRDYPAYIVEPEKLSGMAGACGGKVTEHEVYNS